MADEKPVVIVPDSEKDGKFNFKGVNAFVTSGCETQHSLDFNYQKEGQEPELAKRFNNYMFTQRLNLQEDGNFSNLPYNPFTRDYIDKGWFQMMGKSIGKPAIMLWNFVGGVTGNAYLGLMKPFHTRDAPAQIVDKRNELLDQEFVLKAEIAKLEHLKSQNATDNNEANDTNKQIKEAKTNLKVVQDYRRASMLTRQNIIGASGLIKRARMPVVQKIYKGAEGEDRIEASTATRSSVVGGMIYMNFLSQFDPKNIKDKKLMAFSSPSRPEFVKSIIKTAAINGNRPPSVGLSYKDNPTGEKIIQIKDDGSVEYVMDENKSPKFLRICHEDSKRYVLGKTGYESEMLDGVRDNFASSVYASCIYNLTRDSAEYSQVRVDLDGKEIKDGGTFTIGVDQANSMMGDFVKDLSEALVKLSDKPGSLDVDKLWNNYENNQRGKGIKRLDVANFKNFIENHKSAKHLNNDINKAQNGTLVYDDPAAHQKIHEGALWGAANKIAQTNQSSTSIATVMNRTINKYEWSGWIASPYTELKKMTTSEKGLQTNAQVKIYDPEKVLKSFESKYVTGQEKTGAAKLAEMKQSAENYVFDDSGKNGTKLSASHYQRQKIMLAFSNNREFQIVASGALPNNQTSERAVQADLNQKGQKHLETKLNSGDYKVIDECYEKFHELAMSSLQDSGAAMTNDDALSDPSGFTDYGKIEKADKTEDGLYTLRAAAKAILFIDQLQEGQVDVSKEKVPLELKSEQKGSTVTLNRNNQPEGNG